MDRSTPIAIPTKDAVHQALKEWGRGDVQQSPLADMFLYQQVYQNGLTTIHSATNQVLSEGIDSLAQVNPADQKILVLRFIEDRPGHEVARMLSIAEGHLWRRQNEAIQRLTELFRVQEEEKRAQRLLRFAGRLETSTYTLLFGRETHLATLREQFMQPGPPWMVAIEGIGGIGKTALADMLVRRLLGDAHWYDMAWVTARQQLFNAGGAIKAVERPALTTEALVEELVQQLFGQDVETAHLIYGQKLAMLQDRLRERPHLIVIDNLETFLDVDSLLDCLRELADPTKFLLTTRFSRFHETDIFHFTVPELNDEDALALVRQEAHVRNVPSVTSASDEDLLPIVATVGGNPLALRLVVGQLHTRSLDRVLGDLRSARGQTVTGIYTYIYRQVWQDLEEEARLVLLLMPLVVDSGGDFAYLVDIGAQGGLSETAISDGLDQLVGLNLVDSRGDLHQRRYSIHSLTRTFLQQQVLGWSDVD